VDTGPFPFLDAFLSPVQSYIFPLREAVSPDLFPPNNVPLLFSEFSPSLSSLNMEVGPIHLPKPRKGRVALGRKFYLLEILHRVLILFLNVAFSFTQTVMPLHNFNSYLS